MNSGSKPGKPISFLPDIAGLYGFLTFALLVIFDSGKALVDGDTLWHIAAGRHMLAEHSILTQDIFSHTVFGKPWTAHEWLSEIIMAWLHQHTGITGTVIFFFLVAALSFWLLFRIVSDLAGDWIAIFSVSVALTFSMTHMLARPHVFSWLFGVITLYALHKRGRWYWLLPLITIFWANLHGGFILGLALQGLVLGGEILEHIFSGYPFDLSALLRRLRRPAAFFVLSILAAAINPFGFRLYLFPFQVTSGIFSTGIVEWLSPDFQEQWLFKLFLLLMLLFMSLRRMPTTWTDRLFVLFFFNAALTHQRYIGMTAVFLCPYFARMLSCLPWPTKRFHMARTEAEPIPTSSVSGPVITIVLATTLILFAGFSGPRTKNVLETFLPLPSESHPVKAVEYLNRTRPPGRMFNKYSWGGYLIYAMDPPQKVFIDGRADMYGEEIFGDYQKIASLDKEAEELLDRYQIDWILFPTDSALVRFLKATQDWQETYSDGAASILVRRAER